MKPTILITNPVHDLLIAGLEEKRFAVEYKPTISLAQVHQEIDRYHGIIISTKIKADRSLLEKAYRLRFVARLGSGLDIIDLPYAKSRGLQVFSAPEGNRNAVAEHLLGMLLALCNNLLQADREVRNLKWKREQNRGIELMGKTIGIIGFGNNGNSFARVLSGLNVEVLAYDKYKDFYLPPYGYLRSATQEEIQQKADVISLHVPLTDETHYMIDDKFIKKCKKGVIFLNASRGKVVNFVDLLTHLENGFIGGAALDVFENEKPATYTKEEQHLFERFFGLPNVMVSPHIAGWTNESKERISKIILARILKVFPDPEALVC